MADDQDELEKRLDKLRDFNKQTNVSDDQLESRLRSLKGLNVNDGAKRARNYFVPTQQFKSEAEEADFLFKQFKDEVNLEKKNQNELEQEDEQLVSKLSKLSNKEEIKYDNNFNDNFVKKTYDKLNNQKVLTQDELEIELNVIKSKMRDFNCEYKDFNKTQDKKAAVQSNCKMDNFFTNQLTDSSEEDEERFIGLVEKFVDEAKLDSKSSANYNRKKECTAEKEANDEVDFCYICTEDAVLDCKDCEDLFCLNCFKEFHQDPEYRNHRYSKFRSKS